MREHKRQHIAVYADGQAAIYLLRLRLKETFGKAAIDIMEVKQAQILSGEYPNKNTLAFILPGTPGGSSSYRDQLGQHGFSAIRRAIDKGTTFYGFCAGAYLAASEFKYYNKYTEQKREIASLLPLMEGIAEGPIEDYVDFHEKENPWADYAMAKIDFTNAAGEADIAGIYYSCGPTLKLYDNAVGDYDVLARFRDVAGQPIAAIRRNDLGLGKAILVSFPAEVGNVQSAYVNLRHSHAAHGLRLIKQLHPWEDSRRRFWDILMQDTIHRSDEAERPSIDVP
jgi:glutamine amidotransferase-like uncharacterized protein